MVTTLQQGIWESRHSFPNQFRRVRFFSLLSLGSDNADLLPLCLVGDNGVLILLPLTADDFPGLLVRFLLITGSRVVLLRLSFDSAGLDFRFCCCGVVFVLGVTRPVPKSYQHVVY